MQLSEELAALGLCHRRLGCPLRQRTIRLQALEKSRFESERGCFFRQRSLTVLFSLLELDPSNPVGFRLLLKILPGDEKWVAFWNLASIFFGPFADLHRLTHQKHCFRR